MYNDAHPRMQCILLYHSFISLFSESEDESAGGFAPLVTRSTSPIVFEHMSISVVSIDLPSVSLDPNKDDHKRTQLHRSCKRLQRPSKDFAKSTEGVSSNTCSFRILSSLASSPVKITFSSSSFFCFFLYDQMRTIFRIARDESTDRRFEVKRNESHSTTILQLQDDLPSKDFPK